MYYIFVNLLAVIWYYFSYTFLYNTLAVSNSLFLVTGASFGSLVFGVLLHLLNNKKVRGIFYILNILTTIILYHLIVIWSKYVYWGFFVFGVSFSIAITDFIKYIYEHYANKMSLLINSIGGCTLLCVMGVIHFMGPMVGKPLKVYLIIHSIITSLNVIALGFTNMDSPKKDRTSLTKYFTEASIIFKNKKLIFYYLFLIINTMGVVAGNTFFFYPKYLFFVRLGMCCASLLYYFILPRINIDKITIFMMIFFNFLIYFKFFSPAAVIVGHVLFGISISSMFLAFIYSLGYKKHLGLIFGIFHFTILTINILFRKFLMFNSGTFLTKDLHVILLQINNRVIIHFYGYHMPIIIITLFTMGYYFFIVKDK